MKINAVSNNYNIKDSAMNLNNIHNNPSFGSIIPKPVVNGLTDFYGKVIEKDGFQKFVKGFSKSDKSFTNIMIAESIILSGFYMINTLTNKKIKKEQKPQMLINDTLTLGVSAGGAYFLDDKVTKCIDKFSDNFMKKHGAFYSDQMNKGNFKDGMKKIKTLVIFGLIYRYLGPVLITPLANKLSSKLFNKNETSK